MKRSISRNQIPKNKFQSRPGDEQNPFQRHFSTAKRTVRENPAVTVMTFFGAGLALGAVVGSVLADVGRSSPPTLTDRIQRRMDSVLSDMIPASLEERFHG